VLTPAASNKMYGRNDFLIHGDNKKGDTQRQRVALSLDQMLVKN